MKYLRLNKEIMLAFIDIKKAFDNVGILCSKYSGGNGIVSL